MDILLFIMPCVFENKVINFVFSYLDYQLYLTFFCKKKNRFENRVHPFPSFEYSPTFIPKLHLLFLNKTSWIGSKHFTGASKKVCLDPPPCGKNCGKFARFCFLVGSGGTDDVLLMTGWRRLGPGRIKNQVNIKSENTIRPRCRLPVLSCPKMHCVVEIEMDSIETWHEQPTG